MKIKNKMREAHSNTFGINKLFQIAVACCMCFMLASIPAHAEFEECDVYSGSNVNKQNYTTYGSPMKSYLVTTENSEYMRVQGDATSDQYLIEYYDQAFSLAKTVKVSKELDIFGGFYYDGRYYYILSGQMNREESDSVEVYRLTKYDTDWKRLSSAGLYGANTYIPFDAGSARMDHDGDMLFIRTCHEMYLSGDGKHHQANVTIQVNTSTMEIVDSYYIVMNTSYGYASHSFNQFIKLDGGKIVGVDHGDASPRSVALFKYKNLYTASGFTKSATCIPMLTISGEAGANSTGVSVGGFELSSNNYLVAGNAVEMGTNYKASGTRNIFVSSLNRSAGTTATLHTITNYSSGDASPSTPQLVKLSDDGFMLLWMKDGQINYCKIDGNGDKVGSIYTMEGSLSDCQPIVNGNQIVWYTWKNEINTFYTIDVTNLSKTDAIERVRGHKFEVTYATESNPTAKKVCTVCGYTETFTTLDSFSLWWWTGSSGSSYISATGKEGEKHSISIRSSSPSDVENRELELRTSNPKVLAVEGDTFSYVGAGKATLTVVAKYRPNVKLEKSFTVTHVPVGETTVKKVSTCKTPGEAELMCSYCDGLVTEELALDPNNHSYDEGVITKEPTCKAVGTKTYTCEECERTKTESVAIDTTKHKWNTGTVITQPTCTTVGVKAVTCTLCSAKDQVEIEIDPENHSFDEGVIKLAPTCSVSGEKVYTCTRCETEKREIIAKNPNNHSWDDGEITVPSTCAVKGSKTFICEWCENTKTESVPLDNNNHEYDQGTITTPATCISKGVKTYTCKQCQNKKTESIAVDPDNHQGETYVLNKKVSNCVEKGYSGDCYCKDCDAVLEMGKELPETGIHNYVTGVCSVCEDVWMTTKNEIVYQVVTKEVNGKLVGVKEQENGETRIVVCVVGVEDVSDKKLILPGKMSIETEDGTMEKYVVTTIAANAFEDSGVKEVVIPDTVTELKENALVGVSSVSFNSVTPPAGIANALENGTTIQIPKDSKEKYEEVLEESETPIEVTLVENTTVHEHDWSIITVVVKPTTTSTGLRLIECSICGESKEETIEKIVEDTPNTSQQSPSESQDTPSGSIPGGTVPSTDLPHSQVNNEQPQLGVVYQDGTVKFVITNLFVKEAQFVGCTSKNAKTITIPATVACEGVTFKVTSVKAKALKGYKKATKIVVGKNVKKIGNDAFGGCAKMKTLTIKSTKLTVSGLAKKAFSGITKKTKVVVPKSKLKVYKKLFRKKGLAKSVKVTA